MSNKKANPLKAFHITITGYVGILSIAAATGSGLVKALANPAAIGVFMVSFVNWIFYQTKNKPSNLEILGLVALYFGLTTSVIFNFQQTEIIDVLKISLAPFFFVIGTTLACEKEKWSIALPATNQFFILLVLLPLFAWAAQLLLGTTDLSTGKQAGIFANRNNAGLYAIAVLAFYCVIAEKPITNPLPYLCVGLMFGTLGLLASVVVALFISLGKIRHFVGGLLIGILLITGSQSLPELSSALRIKPVLDTIFYIATGRINIATATYGELVALLNTSDLSFIFRLKHWHNLIALFVAGNWNDWLFGFGSSASIRFSDMQLIPHNDYIRVLFEFGAITFAGFAAILFSSLTTIRRSWASAPFLAICIYFMSENLLNNYLAMSLFFFSAGVMTQRARLTRTTTTI